MFKSIKFTQKLLLFFLLAIVFLIVATPFVVKSVSIFNREQSEAMLLLTLIVLSLAVYKIYMAEARKRSLIVSNLRFKKNSLEKRLNEAFEHIGKINIQINEIHSLFSDYKIYPDSKKELNNTIEYFAKKILSLVNTDWLFLKIIDLAKYKTLLLHQEARGEDVKIDFKILNRDIINNSYDSKLFSIVKSKQQNLSLKAVCIMPRKQISAEQEALINAIISRLELVYIVFYSHYYNDNRPIFKTKKTK